MILTGTLAQVTAADVQRRRIVGLIVPFGEVGHGAVDGEPRKFMFEEASLTWDHPEQVKLVVDHTGDRPVFAGKARDIVSTPQGLVATFAIAKTQAGDDLLVEASEGLRTGLSIEADIPAMTEGADGVLLVTADAPGLLRRVAAVERPAFASAQVAEVAAHRKEPAMTSTTVEAAEVPDATLADAISALTDVVGSLQQSLPAPAAADQAPAAASAPPLARGFTAATSVQREAFPYGYDSAPGTSLFRDLVASQKDGDADAGDRFRKAEAMMNERSRARRQVKGRNLIPSEMPAGLTGSAREQWQEFVHQLSAANEPVTRSTLLIPNVYDEQHYAAQLRFPRVVADQVPGVAIDNPRPIITPVFTSATADAGSGEPVIASSEGTNPAQAELNVGSVTVTPVWYHGLFDIARAALDAGSPATDALCMGALHESYNQVTETAAVTAILANGTAGTDVATNADTVDVEPRSALKSIRTQMGTFFANRGAPADAILYASDVYQAALGADGTDGRPLYAFMADRYQVVNAAGAADQPHAGVLNVYGTPGQLAFKLTATKFVIVKWADVIRYESPTYEFRLQEPVAPASVRLAIGGYFAQRTLQAKGVRYFSQL